jgi:hypothetical protein
MRKLLTTVLILGLTALPVLAQTPALAPGGAAAATPASSGHLPDRFQIDTGFFRVKSSTTLWLNTGSGVQSEVNFENDLGLKPNTNTFWVDTAWRLGRRHQLKVAFTSFTRENSTTLARTFTWNDKTYAAGLSATASLTSRITSGYYRFALIKKDRFELGPAIGVGYLSFTPRIQATGTYIPPGGVAQTANLDVQATKGSITGDIGVYFDAWMSRNVALRGDYLYIKISPGSTTASITDYRLALDVYPWANVGFGAQYKYNKYSFSADVLKSALGGHLTYSGAQVYLSFLFK